MTQTVTIGRSNVHHIATRTLDGSYTATCGAVRYRNTGGRQGAVRVHTDAEATCSKCLGSAPAATVTPVIDPAAYLPGETPMQRKRRLGLVAN